MTELASQVPSRGSLAALPAVRGFYIFEAALMSAIVLAGFWPFYAELPRAAAPRPPIVYVHAAAFTAWLGLLAMQTLLVYRRNVRLHRRLGVFIAAYAALLIALGIAVALVASADHVRMGEWPLDQAAGFLVLPFGDVLLFGGLMGAAVYYRRTPDVHKRLMLLASNALIFPGAARFADPSLAMILGLWFLPVLLAMAHDRFTMGRIHRVYYIGTAVMLIFFARIALIEAEFWLRIGRSIVRAFL